MIALLCFVLAVLVSPFKSKTRLEAENAALRHQVVVLRRMVHRRVRVCTENFIRIAENAALRHQLIVLRRKVHGCVRLTNNDRWFFIQLYRWFPSILKVLTIIRPKTIVRWHRAGFCRYWRWKSRSLGGRPQIETDPPGWSQSTSSRGSLTACSDELLQHVNGFGPRYLLSDLT